jgi:hypothetical protein
VLHGSMKTTLGQALGLSLAFSRTEMAGKGPQRGGLLVLRLWPTDGTPLKRLGRVGREVRVGRGPQGAHGPM